MYRGSRFHSVIRLRADMGRTAHDHIKCSLSQTKREKDGESFLAEKMGPACLAAEEEKYKEMKARV